MRVKVYDGAKQRVIGYGNYDNNTDVYVIVMPDGSLQSLRDAENKPPDDVVPEGGIVKKISNNPKILMDDGSIRYGCQVWWEPIVEPVQVIEKNTYDPWAISEN